MLKLSVNAKRCLLTAVLVTHHANAQGARFALALHVHTYCFLCSAQICAARTLRTLTCCTTHKHFAFCAGWKCHCHATHRGGVCAAPIAFQNSSDLATLQKFARGVPNLNAALRSRNLTAWEDGGKLCTWEGVTCAVNTTRVSSLTLPSVELEGALALIGRDWPSAPGGPTPHPRAFALGPKERALVASDVVGHALSYEPRG